MTQDVLERVLDPAAAFAEIGRVLRPGGAHIFTVPLYRGRPTLVRAQPTSQGVEYLMPAEYHGNPIDPGGALVVREWGDDLVDFIQQHSGLPTMVLPLRAPGLGLEGEFLDVFVTIKPE